MWKRRKRSFCFQQKIKQPHLIPHHTPQLVHKKLSIQIVKHIELNIKMLKNLSILLTINSAFALRGAKQHQAVEKRQNSAFSSRNLAEASFKGDCTVSSFAGAVGGKVTLASLLGVTNDDTTLQNTLDAKCAEALKPTM